MGTYGKLMELNQPAAAERAQPDTAKLKQAASPMAKHSEVKSASSRHRDTMPPRHPATVVPRYHDTTIQQVRAAVKQFGKEAATHRFTLDEKKAIADLIYSYRKEDIKTNENEISRIGVNFLLTDYRVNGAASILDRVLKALKQ